MTVPFAKAIPLSWMAKRMSAERVFSKIRLGCWYHTAHNAPLSWECSITRSTIDFIDGKVTQGIIFIEISIEWYTYYCIGWELASNPTYIGIVSCIIWWRCGVPGICWKLSRIRWKFSYLADGGFIVLIGISYLLPVYWVLDIFLGQRSAID